MAEESRRRQLERAEQKRDTQQALERLWQTIQEGLRHPPLRYEEERINAR
jgi:hypothetical protein